MCIWVRCFWRSLRIQQLYRKLNSLFRGHTEAAASRWLLFHVTHAFHRVPSANCTCLCSLIKLIKASCIWICRCKVRYTSASSLVNRGVFVLLQHWLAACQCQVTWYYTDGHVSETQTTRRAATRSQQTHTDTQLRPLEEWGKNN